MKPMIWHYVKQHFTYRKRAIQSFPVTCRPTASSGSHPDPFLHHYPQQTYPHPNSTLHHSQPEQTWSRAACCPDLREAERQLHAERKAQCSLPEAR